MREDTDAGLEPTVPIWAVFGDLMSALLGAFVLILVGVIGVQLELSAKLADEVQQRQVEIKRRQALEEALAGPLAAGRVTLVNGRIGISGNVLFALNSDQLQPEGRDILKSLAQPLSDYLQSHDEVLMVSGFTDDQQVRGNNRRFADNWELSAQRALTVTRALIGDGIASSSVFAAAFGSEQPVSSNADESGRSKNRRVEILPVPKNSASSAKTNESGTQIVPKANEPENQTGLKPNESANPSMPPANEPANRAMQPANESANRTMPQAKESTNRAMPQTSPGKLSIPAKPGELAQPHG